LYCELPEAQLNVIFWCKW